MNEMLLVGKIVSTHGIKGELKVISDFEYHDRVYKVNNKVLINNIEHTISSIRYHKQYILMGIDNLDNINEVLEYVGYNIYFARNDLELESNEYLLSDLVGLNIIDNGQNIGIVKEVVKGKANDFLKVKDNFLIPLVPAYIKTVDLVKKEIITNNAIDLCF